MDQTIAALASTIGSRVRRERQARGWTLDSLAEQAGVSRRMLINVEQGVANPSVGTLLRISDALGVGLSALVEPSHPEPVRVTRAGEGAVLWSGDHGGQGVLVAGTRPPDVLELWDWTLGPGERHDSEPHVRGTQEVMQVHEGAVTIDVADQSFSLTAGDAVAFPSDVAHAYSNTGSVPSRFSLAVYEPGVGAGIKKEGPHA